MGVLNEALTLYRELCSRADSSEQGFKPEIGVYIIFIREYLKVKGTEKTIEIIKEMAAHGLET